MRTADGLRLDVRVEGRSITLLDDSEEGFWARFYAPVTRERMHLGERSQEVEQWRLPPAALAAVLKPLWAARVGPPAGGSGTRSGRG